MSSSAATETAGKFQSFPKVVAPVPGKFLDLFKPARYKSYYGGRGAAKAIDVDELVPMPGGWKRLGDVVVGDQVLDEAGRPCNVTAIHEAPNPQRAYRLTFSDGAVLDCCGDHEWVTWNHLERKALLRSTDIDTSQFPADWPSWRKQGSPHATGPQSRTTDQIAATLTYGRRGDTSHCIPLCAALALPAQQLPVDPYVLGYWLANGGTRDGYLTCGSHGERHDHPHITQRFAVAGYPLRPLQSGWTNDRLMADLKQHGLRGRNLADKWLPAEYLRASIDQRTALLQGLMDGDGSVSTDKGSVTFSNTNQALAADLFELVVSLGQRPVWASGRAMLNGTDCGEYYRVSWRAGFNPFSLPRKAEKVRSLGNQGLRARHRMITDASRIAPKPMRCLTVDSPNHMYLVGKWMIPTHNSWQFARTLVTQAHHERHLILCTREFQNSIADSVHRVILRQITAMGLNQWFIPTQTHITSRTTGSEFIFKGLKRNINEIRSLEGVTRTWIEEAQSMSEESWLYLEPTVLREPGAELWSSFNPVDESDPTYKRMVLNPPPNSIIRKVGWQDNPWFPPELEELRKHALRTDPDRYDWVWEGHCRKLSDAVVFRNRYTVEGFDTPTDVDRFFYGGDWGFANDPSVLLRCFIKDDVLYIDYEAYAVGVEIDDLPALFAGGRAEKNGIEYPGVPGAKDWPIHADSARPETISYMRRRGFNIGPADKWPGCVEDGIAHLKGFRRIVVHERCINTAQEFRLFSYKVDDKTGDVLPVLVDKNNHSIDSVRYALTGYIQKRGGLGVWAKLAGAVPRR